MIMKSAFKAKVLASAVAALFAAVSYAAIAADDSVTAGKKKVDAQGRQIDEVKAGGKKVDAQGRAIDEVKAGGKKVDAQGRAIEE